jgi:hypothetical protein
MRGLIASVTLAVAIGGLLLVIAYGASETYLNLVKTKEDLGNTFILGSIAPRGWETSETEGANFNESFVAPCLQTPLLTGVSAGARGAMTYVPSSTGPTGIELLMIRTSSGSAQAIMDDVQRDTENDCQRGLTVGTIERADVVTNELRGADLSVLVDYDRQVGDAVRSYIVLILREGDYVAYFNYETTDAPDSANLEVVNLAEALVARIEQPPTTAELTAAGALNEPSAMERRAMRVHDESSRILTASGRYPVVVGLGALGGLILVLYFFGARLSRGSNRIPKSSGKSSASGLPSPFASAKTTDDYGTPGRRWIQTSELGHSYEYEDPPTFELDVVAEEEEPEPVPVGPPPVLDFPQRSIEEKLKILKEARLNEPRREHRAVREVRPEVDWTEEISKTDRTSKPPTPEPPTGQISRKALLKKLRSNDQEDA